MPSLVDHYAGRHLSDDIPLIAVSQRLVSRPLGLTLFPMVVDLELP